MNLQTLLDGLQGGSADLAVLVVVVVAAYLALPEKWQRWLKTQRTLPGRKRQS